MLGGCLIVSVTDETLAELFAVVVSGRPDALVDVGLGGAGPEIHGALREVREAVATLALAERPLAPSEALRGRVLRSVTARRAAPRRAVLVVDMQNDHLTQGRPLEVPRARDIVPALALRLQAARREKIPVVYVVDEHEVGDSDLDVWGAHNIKGSEGAQIWAPLAPEAGDSIVSKPTYSAFTRSSLAEVLRALHVDTLTLTGCLTELGLLATATDALQRGFAVEVPPDTQAGATAESEQMALGIVGLLSPYGPARRDLLAAVSVSPL
jgi:nicotinamidase-related amidase